MHLTTTTTLLALALSISASATSIPTFRTEIMPSPTMSPSASRIDTSTPLIDSSTNFTVPQRGTGGPARPESLCHGISPMCYAIAHGKRDCHEAWMVCFSLLLRFASLLLLFSSHLILSCPSLHVHIPLTLARGGNGSNTTTKRITAIILRGCRARARRCWSVEGAGK